LAAFEAIESGDYERAVIEFQAALNEKPSDSMSKAGLAQAKLLSRTAHLDIDTELAVIPSNQAELLKKADVLVAIGHSSQGFQLILDEIATLFGDAREPLRKHLVELFEILGPEATEVIEARKRLALLLY
jgi:putative thioredoxin